MDKLIIFDGSYGDVRRTQKKVNEIVDWINRQEEKGCTCYEKGNKPALLTDWRKTNICQSCGKLKREISKL